MNDETHYIERNRVAYDLLAVEYEARIAADRDKDERLLLPFYSAIDDSFLEGVRILDLGCGNGLNLAMFSQRGYCTVGIDLSEAMLKVARRTSPNSILLNGNFLETPLYGESFEAVMAKASIHNFTKEDALKALRRVWDLLVSGGVFYVATTESTRSHEGFFRKERYRAALPRYRKFWTPEELEQAVTSVGFAVGQSFRNTEDNWGKTWFNIIARK